MQGFNKNINFKENELKELIKEGKVKKGKILISPLADGFENIYPKMKNEFINQDFELEYKREDNRIIMILKGYGHFPEKNIEWNSWNIENKIYYFDNEIGLNWIKVNLLRFIEFLEIKYITEKRLKKIKEVYNKVLNNEDVAEVKDLYCEKGLYS